MNIETVRVPAHAQRSSVSADECHFEFKADRRTQFVFAIRLYLDNTGEAVSQRELAPDPKAIKLAEHTCVLL